MVNKNEANKAIAQLDGYSVDGNNIRVEVNFSYQFLDDTKTRVLEPSWCASGL